MSALRRKSAVLRFFVSSRRRLMSGGISRVVVVMRDGNVLRGGRIDGTKRRLSGRFN